MWYEISKRVIDLIIGLTGLIISIPFIVIFGIAIMVESKGSCFYSQDRVGKDGRVFKLYKLRSMYIDAEKYGPRLTDKDDPRITRIGKIIRRYRMDELPQFINILMGVMSAVGPRPERPCFVEEFSREIPGYMERHRVKCGLTGWAQVNGGYDLSTQEKLEEDLYYINNRSIKLDIIILLKTFKVVFSGSGAR